MTETTLRRCLTVLTTLLTAVCLFLPGRGEGGETSVYLKSGWFTWDEKLNGSPFVKERGLIHGAGIARKDLALDRVSFGEVLELWGGALEYDGHDVTGTTSLNDDTSYLGTREELTVGVPVLVSEGAVLEPFGALGHKFWVRTRSSEDWNLLYAKGGAEGMLRGGRWAFFARGGVFFPFYVRNHVDLNQAGFTDVVVEPEGRVSTFAEGGVRRGNVAVSVEYEGERFSQSAGVPTRRLGTGTGAVIVNNVAFQPPSESLQVSLKVTVYF